MLFLLDSQFFHIILMGIIRLSYFQTVSRNNISYNLQFNDFRFTIFCLKREKSPREAALHTYIRIAPHLYTHRLTRIVREGLSV